MNLQNTTFTLDWFLKTTLVMFLFFPSVVSTVSCPMENIATFLMFLKYFRLSDVLKDETNEEKKKENGNYRVSPKKYLAKQKRESMDCGYYGRVTQADCPSYCSMCTGIIRSNAI